MRIKAGQHPLNRAFHQFFVVDLVDIAGFYLAIDSKEFVKILNLLRLNLLLLHILRNEHRAGHGYCRDNGKGGGQQTVLHKHFHFIILSLLYPALTPCERRFTTRAAVIPHDDKDGWQ